MVGRGLAEGCLTPEEFLAIAGEGLGRLSVGGQRVLVLIPDGTRTMPMPLAFDVLEHVLGPRVAALDFLVALGTHLPMSDAQLGSLIGREVVEGGPGPTASSTTSGTIPPRFATLGSIPAREIEELSGGRLRQRRGSGPQSAGPGL